VGWLWGSIVIRVNRALHRWISFRSPLGDICTPPNVPIPPAFETYTTPGHSVTYKKSGELR